MRAWASDVNTTATWRRHWGITWQEAVRVPDIDCCLEQRVPPAAGRKRSQPRDRRSERRAEPRPIVGCHGRGSNQQSRWKQAGDHHSLPPRPMFHHLYVPLCLIADVSARDGPQTSTPPPPLGGGTGGSPGKRQCAFQTLIAAWSSAL